MKTIAKASKKKTHSVRAASVLAAVWVDLRKKEDAIAKDRREVAARLMAKMKGLKITEIKADDDTVHLISDKRKKVNKTLIAEYFGKERTEPFWKGLPDKVIEYLSMGAEAKEE